MCTVPAQMHTIDISSSLDLDDNLTEGSIKVKGQGFFFNSQSNDSIPKRSAVVRELE